MLTLLLLLLTSFDSIRRLGDQHVFKIITLFKMIPAICGKKLISLGHLPD